jgi:hypothetical protein
MAKKKLQLSDVAKKHLKIIGYLVASGGLGILVAYLTEKPELAVVFAPAVNYVIYIIEKELKNEGVRAALKK